MIESDNLFRPSRLKDFFGQEEIVKKLKVFIYSAKKRNSCLDHLLFYGPPGLGKTTLANIIANELKSKIITLSAPSIDKIGDIAQILSTLNAGDILFIDEIHRLDKTIEETLYSVLEDFKLNITYKTSETTKAISIDIAPFTLIGATMLPGLICTPLRDRFGIKFKFNYYNDLELAAIIQNSAKRMKLVMDEGVANEIAKRSRKVPRVANNILKRVYDFVLYKKKETITLKLLYEAFRFLGIGVNGILEDDIKILKIMYYHYRYVPVSLDSIANLLNEDEHTIKEINEPFLVSEGYIERTKRGRKLTKKALDDLETIFIKK